MMFRNCIKVLKRNRIFVIVLAAVILLVTSYLLVFPAFTLDEGTASEMGGISVTMDDAEETSVEGA